MIHISTILLHYKREDVQQAILRNAESREVGVRYGSRGFGKRPEMLAFPGDILSFAQKGASSFHISEEHWLNPLNLSPGMSRRELDELRTGWDLVIDVDFEHWEATKIITSQLIDALRSHGIRSVSVKFSGNKGFHIGVPFRAFPELIRDPETLKPKLTKDWFPEGPRRVLEYLSHVIDSPENHFETSRKLAAIFAKGQAKAGKAEAQGVSWHWRCQGCGSVAGEKKEFSEFICPKCGASARETKETTYRVCDKCQLVMDRIPAPPSSGNKCRECGGSEFARVFNLKIDAMLVSSRHLYRSVYSLHEKSGLVSVPVETDKVMVFEKEMAIPNKVRVQGPEFLDSRNARPGEASLLVREALDFRPRREADFAGERDSLPREFEAFSSKADPLLFPPCIKLILAGISDGRKRSAFILVNFLRSVGWGKKEIEELLQEWNKKNTEPLREVFLKGTARYHLGKQSAMLPPNCANEAYYLDIGVCRPDNLCRLIKNPVQYVRKKASFKGAEKKKKQQKKSEKKNEENDSERS